MWHKVLYIVPVVFASFLWAGASVMQFRYQQSIFAKLKNQKFWNPVLSHDTSKKIFGWKFDGFHCFQSGAIILFCLPIADAIAPFAVVFHWHWLNLLFWWIVIGLFWNIVFENSYERFFTIKKP